MSAAAAANLVGERVDPKQPDAAADPPSLAQGAAAMSSRTLTLPTRCHMTRRHFVSLLALAGSERAVPVRAAGGTSGTYFIKLDGVTLGVYKPSDEVTYARNNPDRTKRLQGTVCPCMFERPGYHPMQGHLSEVGATIVPAFLGIPVVPPTALCAMTHTNFSYGTWTRLVSTCTNTPLPFKMGSFQTFMHGYLPAEDDVCKEFVTADLATMDEMTVASTAFSFQNMFVVDYLIGQTDRNLGNYMIRFFRAVERMTDAGVVVDCVPVDEDDSSKKSSKKPSIELENDLFVLQEQALKNVDAFLAKSQGKESDAERGAAVPLRRADLSPVANESPKDYFMRVVNFSASLYDVDENYQETFVDLRQDATIRRYLQTRPVGSVKYVNLVPMIAAIDNSLSFFNKIPYDGWRSYLPQWKDDNIAKVPFSRTLCHKILTKFCDDRAFNKMMGQLYTLFASDPENGEHFAKHLWSGIASIFVGRAVTLAIYLLRNGSDTADELHKWCKRQYPKQPDENRRSSDAPSHDNDAGLVADKIHGQSNIAKAPIAEVVGPVTPALLVEEEYVCTVKQVEKFPEIIRDLVRIYCETFGNQRPLNLEVQATSFFYRRSALYREFVVEEKALERVNAPRAVEAPCPCTGSPEDNNNWC